MENCNQIYSGPRASGFSMLFVTLLTFAASITSIVMGIIELDKNGSALGGVLLGGGFVLMTAGIIIACGLMMIEPNEARVLLFFGKYRGNFLETGYWWVNPFMSVRKVSLRARNLNVDPIKVNDRRGNPVMIGLVLVWRIRHDDIYRAVFNVDASTEASADGQIEARTSHHMRVLENFVRVQSDAALRQVAGCYAYDNIDSDPEELTLRSNSTAINEQLESRLNERLEMAGIEIVEARINYLAYAPEIAAVMLRRQQADAIISAREKIVDGAVSMVKMALDRLSEQEIVDLDDEKKAAMVSNLLVVLCGDESPQPVVNTGTLYK